MKQTQIQNKTIQPLWILRGVLLVWFMTNHAAGAQDFPSDSPLDVLMLEAMNQHPTVKSRQSTRQSADADVETAKMQYWPTPSISNDFYQGRSIATVRLQQPLWTGGLLTNGLEQAIAQFKVADWSVQEARQGIAERMISAYAEWYRSYHRLKAAQYGVGAHESLFLQISNRTKTGLSPESDQRLAQARLIQARSDLISAQVSEKSALTQLQQLVGRSVDPIHLGNRLESIPQLDSLEVLLGRSLDASPAIQRAESEIKVLEAETKVKSAAMFPQVFARAERQIGSYTDPLALSVNRLVLGVQMTPGAGFSVFSQINSVKARFEAAQNSLDALKRDVHEKIKLSYLDYESSRARSESLVSALEANSGVLESYQRQFLVGRKTWIDLMNAVREVTQSMISKADADTSALASGQRLRVLTSAAFVKQGD